MPGALHAALTVLDRWGTMSFEQVATPAIDYAERGFPLRVSTARAIVNQKPLIDKWPTTRRPGTRPTARTTRRATPFLPALARTLKRMVEAERAAKAKAARRHRRRARPFLQGRHRARDGRLPAGGTRRRSTLSDFGEFFARIEAPAQTTYRGYTVYKHGFGSQGPFLLQTLNILEQFDLKAMGYASADYLHTVTEAMKLAYADRDTYYADPAFVTRRAGPAVEGLCEGARAADRSSRASRALVAGDPLKYDDQVKTWTYWRANIPSRHRQRSSGPP